jgi:hypothetical protein
MASSGSVESRPRGGLFRLGGVVDEVMPDAAAFATIHKPAVLLAASESPPEQREMTEAMAGALPNTPPRCSAAAT